jgi:formylglycine-generating enzyme required for sulfatase activity
MVELTINDAFGARALRADDFPLSVGGVGSTIVLSGQDPGARAHLGVHEEELFVQPEADSPVLHNGLPIAGSAWLRAGDVLNLGKARLRLVETPAARGARAGKLELFVDDDSAGNITVPPDAPAARVAAGAEDEQRIEAISFRPSQPLSLRATRISPLQIALGALLLLVTGLVWFIFSATAVTVSSDPRAQVKFRGGLPAFAIGGRYVLRPGDYTIRLSAPGYQTLERRVTIAGGQPQALNYKLQKLPGTLSIQIPASASVSIDGAKRGNAPGDFELSPGVHDIALRAERYRDFAARVTIEGGGRKQSWAPKLIPDWAVVSIGSEPAGAEILIAGQHKGTTPASIALPSGTHALELRHEGFRPWSADIQVKANEPLTVGPVRLGLPDAGLIVRSQPAGASVTLSGAYRGQTPLEFAIKPEVAQTVVLARAGYEPQSHQLMLKPGERRTLDIVLAGVFGDLTVKTQPADAQLFVDGQPRGGAQQSLRLTATGHDIEIRKPGYVTYKTSITPRPGLAQVIDTTLLTAEQTRVAALPPTVRNPATGLEFKLMPAGTFMMGSARREAGRRANEVQHPVELKRLFYMGTREVTNADFRKFKADHHSGFVAANSLDLERQPVVNVGWEEAVAFCVWLSQQEGLPPAYEAKNGSYVLVNPVTVGYRLPTEAEWEWVARYVDRGQQRRYPWGDALPVAPHSGNYADQSARVLVQDIIQDYDDGFPASAPVGSFAANTLGIFDMGGNVAEWVHDRYSITFDQQQTLTDPAGGAEGRQYTIRGSSWKSGLVSDLRLTGRFYGEAGRNDLGFRVARYAQ